MRSIIGGILNRVPVDLSPKSRLFGSSDGGGPSGSQLEMMGKVPTLFAIVDGLASGTASGQWHLYRKGASGLREDRVEVFKHPALTVWRKPNPHFTEPEFVETVQQHYDLAGEYWWVVGRSSLLGGGGPPVELWPIRPDRIRPVPHPTDFISGYIYGSGKDEVPLGLTDVVWAKRPNPIDPYRGLSPIGSLLLDIEGERAAAAYNNNFFRNGAEPGGIIESPQTLSDPEFESLLARWRQSHQGVSNAHRVAVLEKGKWVERKYTNRDMQFVDLRRFSSETFRQAYRFPKPMLGDVEDINRANAEAAEVVFARWAMKPRLTRLRSSLNDDFLPLFGPTLGAANYEWDFDNPEEENREDNRAERTSAVEAFVALVGMGADWAETLRAFHLPPLTPPVNGGGTVQELAAILQKLYLAVGVVISQEEAREIVNRAGAGLAPGVMPSKEG